LERGLAAHWLRASPPPLPRLPLVCGSAPCARQTYGAVHRSVAVAHRVRSHMRYRTKKAPVCAGAFFIEAARRSAAQLLRQQLLQLALIHSKLADTVGKLVGGHGVFVVAPAELRFGDWLGSRLSRTVVIECAL